MERDGERGREREREREGGIGIFRVSKLIRFRAYSEQTKNLFMLA